jgi:hypothetical protein
MVLIGHIVTAAFLTLCLHLLAAILLGLRSGIRGMRDGGKGDRQRDRCHQLHHVLSP